MENQITLKNYIETSNYIIGFADYRQCSKKFKKFERTLKNDLKNLGNC